MTRDQDSGPATDTIGRLGERETIREDLERLRLAMDVADLGKYDWDLPAGMIHWSGKVREMFGLPADVPLTQATRASLIHPDDRGRALGLFAAAAEPASGGAYQAEYRVVPADGSPERWVSERGQVLFDPAGRPRRFIGIVADNTERKHAELERERLLRELEQAVRMRDDLLAIVSHDLRTPLNSISLAAELLERGIHAGGDARIRKPLDTIKRAGNRMKQLIGDLLDMAITRTGHLVVERSACDAKSLVNEAVEAHAPFATEKGAKLDAHFDLHGESVSCDQGRIQQVFANLIGNAIKFCSPGDKIRVLAAPEGAMVRFSVIDTGPGIPAEALAHLFDPYWSGRGHTRRGTGLGLFISEGIVRAHGGQLWVESVVGEGSAFHFTVPRERA
ncbi:PAS domain-containing sensor histidine kinase [Ramlibacter tataouinensis]|uniref:PAS domain-containing sensor histidine kinase n=1 Tax=Ramlibacter tataouinensis TaxID=94132 RepID=UPI0022F3CC19|nr:PAS domain-containing sensor histidine kinase [Ramlibacter tataouinensis]WBY00576.1 PAS domain-containing sensor histidine kinase [Ramlibacter tataouinensis]